MKELHHPEANLEASFNDSFKGQTLTNAKMPDLAGAHDIGQLRKNHYLTKGDIVEMSSLVQDRLSIRMDPPVPSWGLLLVFSFLPR
jgi:hypothetical protein